MLSHRYLRQELSLAAEKLSKRGYVLDIAAFEVIEERRKVLQVATEQLQNQRNIHSKKIGIAKAKGEDIQPLLEEVKNLGDELTVQQNQLHELLEEYKQLALRIPNLPDESVPVGVSEKDNQEIRKWGEPKTFSFTPSDHVTLGEKTGGLRFDLASKLTGSRFVVMQKQIARLHRALTQFMLDIHTQEHGYQEMYVPYIVNQDTLYGTGQLPKLADDQFKLTGEDGYYLIPTSEAPLTNIVRDTIIDADQLPLRYVAHTPCFRKEAGSYGKDTRGILRQHQFEKVELVWIVKPEESYQAHEQLTQHAETILQKLDLPYRVVSLCGGDLGFSAAKTYDIEVWLPGQNNYREISSCSNCEAFQARRMHARFRHPETNKPELVHTLNGSGLAVGRTLIAVMENYQEEDGHITIPHVLRSYMNDNQI